MSSHKNVTRSTYTKIEGMEGTAGLPFYVS